MIDGLAAAGWQVPSPAASMFAWAPIPEQFAHLGSLEFSKLLLQEAKVAVAPGVGFGEYGDGHVRLALVENVHRIRQATRSIKEFFRSNAAGAAASRDPEARRALLDPSKVKVS
jgi:alanine-synthesizing transaminase